MSRKARKFWQKGAFIRFSACFLGIAVLISICIFMLILT